MYSSASAQAVAFFFFFLRYAADDSGLIIREGECKGQELPSDGTNLSTSAATLNRQTDRTIHILISSITWPSATWKPVIWEGECRGQELPPSGEKLLTSAAALNRKTGPACYILASTHCAAIRKNLVRRALHSAPSFNAKASRQLGRKGKWSQRRVGHS